MTNRILFRTFAIWWLILPILGTAMGQTASTAESKEKKEAAQSSPSTQPALLPAHNSGGYLAVGGVFSNLSGSENRIGEFNSIRQGTRPVAQFGAWDINNGFAYEISGERGVDPNDQRYSLNADIRRWFRTDFTFSKLPHRLENDPLTNLDTAKGTVVVRSDRGDAGVNYCPYYQETEIRNRLTLPFFSALSVKFDYRDQGRKGTSQAHVISKCANCHISSKVRQMDQQTREFRTGAELRISRVKLEYEYSTRDFQENAPVLMNTYDAALHPSTLAKSFLNRVQYDSSNGPLPFAVAPRFRKNQHTVRGRLDLEKAGEFQATFLTARSLNEEKAYGVNTRVVGGIYNLTLGERFHLTLRARDVDLDSDSFFVQVNEPVAPAGTPQAGLTFSQAYPSFGKASYDAVSSLAREVWGGSMEGRMQLAHRTIARVGYFYEDTYRPEADVAKSITQKVKFSLTSSPHKEWKGRVGYTYTHTNTPFTHVKAAFTPEMQPYPSAGNPPSPLAGVQYYVLYGARQANLSNVPTGSHETYASSTWMPMDRFAFSAHLRANQRKNSQLNFGGWSDNDITPSAELWYSLNPRIDLTANYTYHRRRTETLFVIPVFDG